MEIKKIGKTLEFDVEAQGAWYDPKDCLHNCINYIYSRNSEADVWLTNQGATRYVDWPGFVANPNCYRSSSYANQSDCWSR